MVSADDERPAKRIPPQETCRIKSITLNLDKFYPAPGMVWNSHVMFSKIKLQSLTGRIALPGLSDAQKPWKKFLLGEYYATLQD